MTMIIVYTQFNANVNMLTDHPVNMKKSAMQKQIIGKFSLRAKCFWGEEHMVTIARFPCALL